MISLAKFSIRRPLVALVGWLAVVVALTVVGLSVKDAVSPQVTAVKGTSSYQANQLAEAKFGPSQLMPLLLEGPKAQLDKQGPKLVVALMKRGNTRVLSAWDAGTASAGLRPKPTAAMIVISVPRSETDVVKTDLPQIKGIVSRQITAPVKGYLSGQPTIDQALKDESVHVVETAAVIAIGVLFVVLLLGLRAPLAAALVTVVAGATTMSSFGLMALLGKAGLEVDALALATGAIAGIARGASFSVVMLDRFHRERDAHPDGSPDSLLPEIVGTTGRALLYAGTVMAAALLLADVLGATNVLETLGIGALLCTLLATGAAVVVVPAGLALFGDAVNWRFPAPAFLSRIWDRMIALGGPITRHPLAAGSLATAGLLALAVPALGIKAAPMDVQQFPPDNQARIAFSEINHVMGPGYATPYSVIFYNPKGPITSASMLSKINGFEGKIAKDPAVVSVVGPGANFYASSKDLSKVKPGLQHSIDVTKQSKKDLLTLINGLGLAGAGSQQLQSGLAQAASGANQLHGGTGQAQSGAALLHNGLAQARAGSDQLSTGLNQALDGANALKTGAGQALIGSTQLLQGVHLAQGPAAQSLPALSSLAGTVSQTSKQANAAKAPAADTKAAVGEAIAKLQSVASTDPAVKSAIANALASLTAAQADATNTASAIADVAGSASGANYLASVLNYQAPGLMAAINMLHDGSSQLASGIEQLRNGNAQLAGGIGQLAGGGGQLRSGLGQLTNGASQLQAGLALLNSGTGQLASGLEGGVGPAGQLVTGLGTMQSAVVKARGQIPSTADLERLFKQSPGLFNSGYFVLAAVAGAPPADRNAAQMILNLYRGGNAGQIIVTSRYPSSDFRAEQLGQRLRTVSSSFAKANGLEIAVGGVAGNLFDTYGKTGITYHKLPAVIIGSVIGVALLLMLLMRAILIPLVATLSAALTTAAAMGVMQLLFGGSNPPLGGPGTFDAITLSELLAAIFGASLIYLVVLITRTRDLFVARGDPRGSLVQAMGQTEAATTGIATLTIAVVVPFMFTELQPVRRIAVAAALAVGIMAYVVIPVVLPAAMSLLGRAGWWPTKAVAPGEPTPPRPPRPERAHVVRKRPRPRMPRALHH